jgi:FlaA1/EpsC-like NDP-sugar epimerase
MKKYKNIIIYGAGASGVLLKQLFNKENNDNVFAFIDDNIKLNNRTLVGVKIIHSSHFDADFIRENSIDAILMSNIYIHVKKSSELSKFGLPILLPKDVDNWHKGYISNLDITEVDSSFIINRNISNKIDPEKLKKLHNKKILITGASGSIGSEIVRQLNQISNLSLILIDIDESGLHDLFISLKNKSNCIFYVCDVSNKAELERVISKNKDINKVFHAAAYKHVPIVEIDPYPAIRVNIQGTLNLCELVEKYSINDFILVSTDKAVNPTNIMGATKRCAEIITTYYNYNYNSSFSCTRFGNVIGSRGSVIPIFIDQIKSGGPITLTHNEITRYFMTIPEATRLVIKSSILENDGGIFLFDMGEPIKLIEIVENLKLYYDAKDVEIKYIGLRDGEKMYEELSRSNEEFISTTDKKINKILSKKPSESILNNIYGFLNDFDRFDISKLKIKLKNIIPEYDYEIKSH